MNNIANPTVEAIQALTDDEARRLIQVLSSYPTDSEPDEEDLKYLEPGEEYWNGEASDNLFHPLAEMIALVKFGEHMDRLDEIAAAVYKGATWKEYTYYEYPIWDSDLLSQMTKPDEIFWAKIEKIFEAMADLWGGEFSSALAGTLREAGLTTKED